MNEHRIKTLLLKTVHKDGRFEKTQTHIFSYFVMCIQQKTVFLPTEQKWFIIKQITEGTVSDDWFITANCFQFTTILFFFTFMDKMIEKPRFID